MKTYHRCLYWVAAGFVLMASYAATAENNDVGQPSPFKDEYVWHSDECTSTEKDSLVLNADGNYVITYNGCVTVWEPATKIDPEIVGHMTFNATTQTISYDYQVHNGGKSRQAIAGMRLDGSHVSFNVRLPPGWGGHAENFYSPRPDSSGGFNVGFGRWVGPDGDRRKGIQPGAMLGGIGFDNADLPGVGKVYLWGAVTAENNFPGGSAVPDPYKEGVGKQFAEIQTHDFITRLAPIPMIPVSTPFDPKAPRKTLMPGTPIIPVTTPFDAGNVLTHIQRHVDTDLIKLNLVEPVFVEQLDRLFQVAIAAAKTNDLTAARTYIQDMYKLIEREQGDKTKAIDPLAAKVLVFDLKYIEKRIGEQ